MKMNKKWGIVYQFSVLSILAIMQGWILFTTGDVNEVILGAIIGTLIGLPFKEEE